MYLWGQALRKAYPAQTPRIRPSSLASCAKKQVALVNSIPVDTDFGMNLWQAELGRAGQSIALSAFPHFGFDVKETVVVDGEVPGEADASIEVLKQNIFGLEPGPALGEVKCRNTYVYNHLYKPDMFGRLDILSIEKDTGLQACMYMGQLGLNRCVLILLPFDSAGTRNDQKYSKAAYKCNPYIRVFVIPFQQDIYELGLERARVLRESGLEVIREANPSRGKFPCLWESGGCPVLAWCTEEGYKGSVIAPQIPDFGMPMIEFNVA